MSGPERRDRGDRGPIERALAAALSRHGERPAVAGGGTTWSYAELRRRIDAAAATFDGMLGDGRHVGFRLGNRPEYVSLYFGALEAGCLPLLLDASFNRGEVEAIRADCGLDALVVERDRIEALGLPARGGPIDAGGGVAIVPLERPHPESGAPPLHTPRASTRVCRFTSGTTGRPKCIEFRGEAVVAAAENWVAGTAMSGRDRTLCLAALSNGLAFNTSLLSTFLAGGELHFLSGLPLTRPVARAVAAAGITRLVAFPTLYRNFTLPAGPTGGTDGFSAGDLATLEHAISAGAPLPPEVREAFRERFGLDVSDYYGIAETGPCTFERDPSHHTGLGQPLPGVELRIDADGEDEEGEVLVRTASMASGYLNQPRLFESRLDGDGFYRSGDRGYLRDGRLHLVGRNAGHINVAGRKVDPVEVAGVVRGLDGVADAVAFPDEDLNRETVVHLVVAGRPGEAPERTAVLAACRDRLAHYKVPGLVSFVDEIPRNGIGKPRIGLLRERLSIAGPEARRKESVA
jgi:acyl-CoA synthetase (AMP-forming)/AMP-acid ligase II